MIILVGLVSAIVLSIGLAYAIDYFDPSFHTPEQVMEDLGVPFVVAIPRRRA
jgi:capsular polysaccharide biosynthesis protein